MLTMYKERNIGHLSVSPSDNRRQDGGDMECKYTPPFQKDFEKDQLSWSFIMHYTVFLHTKHEGSFSLLTQAYTTTPLHKAPLHELPSTRMQSSRHEPRLLFAETSAPTCSSVQSHSFPLHISRTIPVRKDTWELPYSPYRSRESREERQTPIHPEDSWMLQSLSQLFR